MPPKFQLPQALFDEAEEIGRAVEEEKNMIQNQFGVHGNNNNNMFNNSNNHNNQNNLDPEHFMLDNENRGQPYEENGGICLSPESVDQVAMIERKDHPSQVREISVALVREFLGAHRRELHDAALESFEAAVPRDRHGLTKRSAIATLVRLDSDHQSQQQQQRQSSTTTDGDLTSSSFLPIASTSASAAAFNELDEPPRVSILERLVSAVLLKGLNNNNNNNNNNCIDGGHDDANDDDSHLLLGNNNNPSLNFGFNDDGVQINGFSVGSTGALNGGGQFSVFSLADLSREDAVVIGQGAGGRVLRMRHNITDEYYAVKEIVVGSAQTINEIKKEISVLWGTCRNHDDLPSPFLITCHGIFYEQGMLYIVMDLMACSLKDALDTHGPFSEIHLRAMFFQVLHGLHYLHHTKKQLHRDIKPHNILISDMGSVKISDFGIASERVQTLHHNARHTFCGTLSYMSPGRAEGLPYSFEADIWGIGMSLFQLAVGQLPEGSRSVFAIAEFRTNPPRLPPSIQLQTTQNNNNNNIANTNTNTATTSSSSTQTQSANNSIITFSKDFQDFVALCLQPEISKPITVKDLLSHPWMRGMTLERSQRLSADVARQIVEIMHQQRPRRSQSSSSNNNNNNNMINDPTNSNNYQQHPYYEGEYIDGEEYYDDDHNNNNNNIDHNHHNNNNDGGQHNNHNNNNNNGGGRNPRMFERNSSDDALAALDDAIAEANI